MPVWHVSVSIQRRPFTTWTKSEQRRAEKVIEQLLWGVGTPDPSWSLTYPDAIALHHKRLMTPQEMALLPGDFGEAIALAHAITRQPLQCEREIEAMHAAVAKLAADAGFACGA